MFQHIAVITVPVRDQEAAKSFYLDVMGFYLIAEGPIGPRKTWVQLGLKGGQTSITLVQWFETMPPGSLRGTTIHVADIVAAHAALADKTISTSPVQTADWGRFFTFSDPDGNGWVAMQR